MMSNTFEMTVAREIERERSARSPGFFWDSYNDRPRYVLRLVIFAERNTFTRIKLTFLT